MTATHTTPSREGGWSGRPSGLPDSVPPPSIPVRFFVAAAAGLVACGVALIWCRSYAVVDPTNRHVIVAAHLAVLATLSMGMLGAIHQFTPVITQKPMRSPRLSRWTFVCWVVGSWLLPFGFALAREQVVIVGGVFAGFAVTLLATNAYPALMTKGKGPPVFGLRCGVGGFVVTACFGVVFAFDRQGLWFQLSGHVIVAHAVIGLFGWLGIVYVSVSEKLWPMFLLAHVPGRRRAAWLAVSAVPLGVALLSPGLLFGVVWLAWLGIVVVGVGLGAHLTSLVSHVRIRQRTTDLHLVFVITSAGWLVVGAAFALAAVLTVHHHHHLGVALVAASVSASGGWVLVALVGHAHKVIPFISWSELRSRGVKENAGGTQLMFADLYNHRLAALAYGVVTVGVAAICLGFAASLSGAFIAGGICFIVTGVVVAANLSATVIGLLATQRPGR